MRRRRLRPATACAAVALLAVVALVPFRASAEPIDDARNQIWAIVNQADAYNQGVLNSFAQAASAAGTIGELDTAYGNGYNALEARWYQANAQIDAIVAEFPELQTEAANAKAKLLDDHNDAHAEMDALYWLVYENLTEPTTTTTSTSTTTTTVPTSSTSTSTSTSTTSTTSTTTTTVPRSSTTTTTEPRASTTTTAPDEPPTTTTLPVTTTTSTTTTTIAAIGVGEPTDGAGGITGGTPSVGDDPAATGQQAFAATSEGSSVAMHDAMSDARHDRAPAMSMIMEQASIVLPPGLVEIAARPLIAIEFIVRAFFDSVASMLVPFILLMTAVGWMLWRESRRTGAVVS